jgi:hypothetical protein
MKMIRILSVLIVLSVFSQHISICQHIDTVQNTTSYWKYSKWILATVTVSMGAFYFIEKKNNKPTDQFLSATVLSGGLTALAFIMDAFTSEEEERKIERKPLEEQNGEKKVIATLKPEIVILEPLPDEKNRIFSEKRKLKIKGIVVSGVDFLLTINNYPVSIDENGFFSYDLNLTEDLTLTDIKLKRGQELVCERNLVVSYKQESMERKGNDYALLFAINTYENWNNLLNPINDVVAIETELKNNYNYKTEVLNNGSMTDIYSMLRKYAQMQFNEDDQLFIFFAGHGKFDEVFKEGFLVTRDSKKNDMNNESYISHAILKQRIDNIPCKHIFLVIDACFGGALDPIIAQSDGRGDNLYSEITKPEFIKRKLKFKTRKYLTSGGKEYVPDGRPGEHSPFARKLLEALRSYGGSDGILTLSKLNNYLEKVQPEPRFGSFGSDEPGSDFIFIAK